MRKMTRCSQCGRELPECVCANKYLREHYVKRLIKLFVYRSSLEENKKVPSNELIYHVKRTDRKDLIAFIASELASAIKNNVTNYSEFLITNIPRTGKRVAKYGHDHSEKVAKAVALELGIEYKATLRSVQKRAQKKLTKREDRFANAKFDYKTTKTLTKKKIFLLDDIVTTGASMGHAAMLIRGLGAKTIVGVCLGIAYRDEK